MRGLKAPPRRAVAPASFTAWADSRICARLSTEHGPAMMAMRGPPTGAPFSGTWVSAGCMSREASLKGLRIGTVFSTPSRASNC
mgnify:CR=1 FL=1